MDRFVVKRPNPVTATAASSVARKKAKQEDITARECTCQLFFPNFLNVQLCIEIFLIQQHRNSTLSNPTQTLGGQFLMSTLCHRVCIIVRYIVNTWHVLNLLGFTLPSSYSTIAVNIRCFIACTLYCLYNIALSIHVWTRYYVLSTSYWHQAPPALWPFLISNLDRGLIIA